MATGKATFICPDLIKATATDLLWELKLPQCKDSLWTIFSQQIKIFLNIGEKKQIKYNNWKIIFNTVKP